MDETNVVIESLIFPTRHLPYCFTNYDLYEKLDLIFEEYGSIENVLADNFELKDGKLNKFKGYYDSTYGMKKGTEPLDVYISKPDGANRIISIVNPLVLIPLHFYINKYHEQILQEQLEPREDYDSSSRFSYTEGVFCRQYDYDGEPILGEYENVTQPNFKQNLINRQKICDGKYYHLGIDISNFYNSIYTHSISWDLIHDEHKKIFDNLDYLNRSLNKNETKGIITGPYTSSLFAEIILSKVDKQIMKYCKEKDISYIRFCDDYDFYSDSKEELENGLRLKISETLSNYKLDLNLHKMVLEEFPFISLNTIQNKDIYLLINRIESHSYETSLNFVEDIMNEINKSLKIKYSSCNYLLKIINNKISKGVITSDNFDKETAEVLLDFLMNTMFKQNMVSKECSNLIIKLFGLIDLDKKRIINKWIRKRKSRLSHLKEITDIWLAYLIIRTETIGDNIDEYMLEIMKKSDTCAVLVLEYLNKNKLIDKYATEIKEYIKQIEMELKQRYGADWKKASYYSRFWLLLYTNSIRWKIHENINYEDTILNELEINNLMMDDELKNRLNIFKIMYKNDIEFLSFKN